MSNHTIVVTGATGQLGRRVLSALRAARPDVTLIGLARTAGAAIATGIPGVEWRLANYDAPESLVTALSGATKVLLVSSSALGRRAEQHRTVITAAQAARVGFLAYTSVLRAGSSPLGVAVEHRETEDDLRASGLAHAILRNGWYTENYTAGIGAALTHGVVLGSAGNGRIAAATRDDYAAAAARVLTADIDEVAGRVFELAGDTGFTMAEYAAELARQSGKAVQYRNLPQADYQAALVAAGLPDAIAGLLAESDAKAADGALFDASGALSQLIGRPTTPLAAAVRDALQAVAVEGR